MARPRIHNPVELGNDFGHIKFGHILPNNTYAGVLVRNGDPMRQSEHYMAFMSSGKMKEELLIDVLAHIKYIVGKNQ